MFRSPRQDSTWTPGSNLGREGMGGTPRENVWKHRKNRRTHIFLGGNRLDNWIQSSQNRSPTQKSIVLFTEIGVKAWKKHRFQAGGSEKNRAFTRNMGINVGIFDWFPWVIWPTNWCSDLAAERNCKWHLNSKNWGRDMGWSIIHLWIFQICFNYIQSLNEDLSNYIDSGMLSQWRDDSESSAVADVCYCLPLGCEHEEYRNAPGSINLVVKNKGVNCEDDHVVKRSMTIGRRVRKQAEDLKVAEKWSLMEIQPNS